MRLRRVGCALLLSGLGACTRSPGHMRKAEAPRSVLLLTVDTLRADRVGAYGDQQARTPNMDALAHAGVLFGSAFAPVPLTLPSHASLLTGLLPPTHGVRGNGSFVLGAGPKTLAESLRARGLQTAAFVGGFTVARRFGLDRGFDTYDDTIEKAPGIHYGLAERRADRVVEAARAWLAAHPGPVFAWVHLFDPHAPYDPPPAFRSADLYRGEIAFADVAIGSLLAAWDARPGASVVALTGDHGEAFGEHGEESHGLFAYDTTLRVPLVVRAPELPAGRRVDVCVGIVNLPSTLLELAGYPIDLPGRVLLDRKGRLPVPVPLYAETLAPRLDFGWSELRVWRDGRYKYVRAPRPELYDVQADPGETRNLVEREPLVASRMASALKAALAGMSDAEHRRAADPETAERLRALGYVQGFSGRGSGADPKDKLEVALRIARAAGPFPDLAAAARAYREIVELDPDNPVANFRLADALLRSGRIADAVPFFENAVASGPLTADSHVGLATAYALLGRMEDAHRVLEAALGIDPRNGQVHYNLGEVARVRGDVVGARAQYQAALADPVTRDRARARLEALR